MWLGRAPDVQSFQLSPVFCLFAVPGPLTLANYVNPVVPAEIQQAGHITHASYILDKLAESYVNLLYYLILKHSIHATVMQKITLKWT